MRHARFDPKRLYRAAERVLHMSNAGAGLYRSGLERDDWYALKNVLIEYSLEDTKAAFERLPSRLQASTVGARIREYVQSGEPARREDAVALMAPGMSNVELLLEKA